MERSEKLEVVGYALGILAIFALAQSPLLNTIGIIMGLRILFRLGAIYKKSPSVRGIYVSSEMKIYLCKVADSQSKPFQLQPDESSSAEYDSFVRDTLASIRKGYRRWPHPKIFFCPSLGAPLVSADFYKMLASTLGIELFAADPRICAAIGAGLTVTDFSKQIVITVTSNAVFPMWFLLRASFMESLCQFSIRAIGRRFLKGRYHG